MSRRLAREMALQTLFQLDFSQADWPEAFAAVAAERHEELSPASVEYAKAIIAATLDKQKEIDEIIDNYAEEWTLERMASVDRNILRLAIYEMRFSPDEISPGIAINEAVEIAKVYGSDDSPRFINGMLGKMAKKAKD